MKKITSRFAKSALLFIFAMLSFNNSFSQCSDQFLLGTSNSNGSGYNWADAFTASCTGNIEYVQFYSNSAATAAAGTLKIYNGAGVTTTPVYTQAYPSIPVAGGVMRVNLTGEFPVVSGTQYTFSLYVNGVNIVYYPSFGGAWQNGISSYKHNFKVGILANLATETFDVTESTISPNPSNGNFSIQRNQPENIMVEVYNVLGKKIFSEVYQNLSTCNVNLDHAVKGIYFVKINNGKAMETRKIIIK